MALDISLHAGQAMVMTDPHKIRVLVSGRRWGKSKLMLYSSIIDTLSFPGQTDLTSPETTVITLPTLAMAKRIIWQPLVNLVENTDLSKYVKKINKTDLTIQFYGRKPSIVVTSSLDDQGNKMRGLRMWRYKGDEHQNAYPTVLDEVVRPALSDTPGSKALITGTPLGKMNHLYELFCREQKAPNIYKSFNMPTWTNTTIPGFKAEVEEARLSMPPRAFRQEYCADFIDPVGQVYTQLNEDNLGEPPTHFDMVVIGEDFGDIHPHVCALGRHKGVWWYIEGWQPNQERGTNRTVLDSEVDANALRLAEKYKAQLSFADPSRPSSILRQRKLDNLGLARMVAGFNRIAEGIGQVHVLIHRKQLMFSTATEDDAPDVVTGLQAYNYHYEYHYHQKPDSTITDEPEDGLFSHCCDAVRYGLAIKTGSE